MGHHPRRLRDLFNPPPEIVRPTAPSDTRELVDEVAGGEEIDVEGLASQFKESERHFWRAIEEELKNGRRG